MSNLEELSCDWKIETVGVIGMSFITECGNELYFLIDKYTLQGLEKFKVCPYCGAPINLIEED